MTLRPSFLQGKYLFMTVCIFQMQVKLCLAPCTWPAPVSDKACDSLLYLHLKALDCASVEHEGHDGVNHT